MKNTLSQPVQNKRPKSAAIYEEACKVIPGGVNSPVRSFRHMGITPIVAKEGRRDELVDADGNRYIDYCLSWGALIHGHAHPLIVEKATGQLRKGSSFGVTTEIEGKIAKKITEMMPSIEKVRFVSSGTEATMSAIRLARGFTGRDGIVKFSGCYHGHSDLLLVQAGSGVANLNVTSSSLGVPQDAVKHTLVLPFNDFEKCKALFKLLGKNIAAVIVEPIPANMGVVPPAVGFLQMLREETEKAGALLIFDEVISGFRVGLTGAQGLFGVTPDLTTLGKIIGGGFPAAAFGGRAEIMDHLAPLGQVYQAGTLSGAPVAMEAGLCALQLCEEPPFYKRLEERTKTLLDPIQELIERKGLNVALQRVGSMFTLFFGAKKVENFEEGKKIDKAAFNDFVSHLLLKGIYFSPAQYEASFLSSAHTEDNILYTRDVILDYLEQL